MKQKVLFSLLILMLMSISVSAQTGGGRIAGVVIDNTDEDPLPGATLFIEELKKGDVTNKYGEFSFSDIPFGTYTFTVKFMGYQTAVQKVTVSKENVKKTIIRLKAEVKSLDEVVVMCKSEAREDDEDFQNPVDLMFERLEEKDPEHFAVKQYKKYKLAAGDICSK